MLVEAAEVVVAPNMNPPPEDGVGMVVVPGVDPPKVKPPGPMEPPAAAAPPPAAPPPKANGFF